MSNFTNVRLMDAALTDGHEKQIGAFRDYAKATNKTDNARINVILRRVHVTIFAGTKQAVFHTLSVCLQPQLCRKKSTHGRLLHCHLWRVLLYHIFFPNGAMFGKNATEGKMCIAIFLQLSCGTVIIQRRI
jgi:hypothetical protein